MSNMLDISKKIIKILILLSVLVCVGAFFVIDNKVNLIEFILGAFFGTLMASLKIISMEKVISKVLELEKEKATVYSMLNYLFRFIITAVILIISIRISKYLCFGIFSSLLALQPAIFLNSYLEKRKSVEDESENNEQAMNHN